MISLCRIQPRFRLLWYLRTAGERLPRQKESSLTLKHVSLGRPYELWLVRELLKKRRRTEVSVPHSSSGGAVGRHNSENRLMFVCADAISTRILQTCALLAARVPSLGRGPVLRPRVLICRRRTRDVDILIRHRNSSCYPLKHNSGHDAV